MDIRKISADIYKTHKVSGKSFKYNQLFTVRGSGTQYGITMTSNNDGSYTLNGTATATTYFVFNNITDMENKYIFYGFININSAIDGVRIEDVNYGMNTSTQTIHNRTQYGTVRFAIRVLNETTLNNVKLTPILIDLTQVFGAGNEPTTLEQFYATDLGKAIQNGWYPTYTTGAIYNAKSPFVFSGRNLLDISKVFSKGAVVNNNDGSITITNSYFTNLYKDNSNGLKLNVLCPKLKVGDTILFNMETISQNRLYLQGSSHTILGGTPYIIAEGDLDSLVVVYGQNGQTITIKNLILQLSTETDTNYVPYTHNELTRTGKVDLGSLVCNKIMMNNGYGFFMYLTTSPRVLGDVVANIFTNKYKNTTYWDIYNKSSGYYIAMASDSDNIVIFDESMQDKTAQEFKQYISGQFLEYETNEPMELRSVNTIKDTYENASGKKDIFFNEKDLGTLDWQYITGEGSYPFFRASLIGAKTQKLFPPSLPNSITYKYTCRKDEDITIGGYDKCFAITGATGNEKIMIRDSVYTDLSSFVSAISGQKLIYELADQTTETHGTIMLSKNITKCVDSNGIELEVL